MPRKRSVRAPVELGSPRKRVTWQHRCRNHPKKACRTYFWERARAELCRSCRTNQPSRNQMSLLGEEESSA